MPSTYTYPGVYIEELPSGQHTITGVATSIAVFIGWAPQGPVTEPVMVESWPEYQAVFGGWDPRSYLGYAVNQFFTNGGTQAYIIRLVADNAYTASGVVNGLPLWANSPGGWGNHISVAVTQPPQPASPSPSVGFTLSVSSVAANGKTTLLESYSNLSLLPTSSQYVVTVINSDSSYITFVNPTSPTLPIQIPGSTVTLAAAASGNPTPAVQWQVSTDGGITFTDIAGATSTTYSFVATAAQTGNQYHAVFTNAAGIVTSSAATLTVSAFAAPAVTSSPTNQSVNTGSAATFTAAASGNPTPAVHWQVSTDGGGTFTDITGATSTTYSFVAIVAQTGNQYRAVFTNAAGTVNGPAATLTVSAILAAPVVTSNPTNQNVNSGSAATFSSAASGNPTPAVHWQLSTDGGATFTDIAGATSTTYSFVATAAQTGNQYHAVFTNSQGTVTSPAATLTISAFATPVVTSNPTNQSVNTGSAATFTAAASGNPMPAVHWQVSTDGGATFADIAGATSTTYSFVATAAQTGSQYHAVFTNSQGTVTSPAATLTVTALLAPPVVTGNPTNQTVSVGPPSGSATVTLSTGQTDTVSDGDVLDPTDAINTGEFTSALFPIGSPTPPTGYLLLEQVQIFNLMCVPGYSNAAEMNTLQQYCNQRRAFLIVDPPQNMTHALLFNSRAPLDGANLPFSSQYLSNSAYYFPWISAPDPLFGGRAKLCPPCGFVAGIYAATDGKRGVWKAPAGINANLGGLLGLQYQLSDNQNGDLNPFAINCLRQFTSIGNVVWGARTMAGADIVGSEWKYVPIRRLALYIESSLYDGTQWVVFEPNDETLWGQIRLSAGTFMQGLFLQGAFAGTTPAQAYFVKCDGENNPDSSTALGIVNILVGFAPLYPAEFVVIQIQQITNQS